MLARFLGAQRRSPTVQLLVEPLEGRDCPAAPVITAFSATILQGQQVLLTGTVSDECHSSVSMTFSGVASGSVLAGADGSFSLTTQAYSVGQISALGLDAEGLLSDFAVATIDNAAPTIVNLTIRQLPNRGVAVSGRVVDENPAGLLVTLSGVATGMGVTAADGTFSITGQARQLGTVYATVADVWGDQASASVELTNTAPVIRLFESVALNGGYQLRGRVSDECPAGVVVHITGPGGLTLEVAVDEDGYFYCDVTEPGLYTATAVDCWGAVSEPVSHWIG